MKAASAFQEEPKQETPKQKAKRLMKERGLVKHSLPIRIMESELFDFDPTARMTMLIIALGQRKEKEDYSDTWIQEDCPWTAEEMVGWCDFSQWRLSQRVGTTEHNLQRVIEKLEAKGVILIETWLDSNNARHNRYKIVEDKIDANQRPEHTKDVKRPGRYKKKASSRGRFTSENQPNRVNAEELLGAEEVMEEVEEL
jgi:DNA mismatch repair ATPase MutS